MPRKPGVYFYRGHFVTKFGCGDGPPVKLCPARGKSDREARQAAETELRRLVVERDQNRAAAKPVSQVTVEDLVEELVGEIADEHDQDADVRGRAGVEETSAALTAPGGEHTYLVDGVLRSDELLEQTGFRLPEGPYETLAGFLMARLGHIPVPGEVLDERGWEFTVIEVERHRIEQVRAVRREDPDA